MGPVALLAALAAAEAAARIAEPHAATRPLVWHDPVAQAKWLQMRALRHRRPSTVVLGNSMALVGIDPTSGLGDTYNAALHRAVPTVTQRWTADVVLPLLRPARVILAASVLDFNDNGSFHRKIDERYRTAPITSTSVRGALLRASSAARLGRTLLAPRVMAGAGLRALGWKQPAATPVVDLIRDDGWGCEFEDVQRYAHTDNNRGWLTESILCDYELGGRQADAFRQTVAMARRTGSDIAGVLLPVTSDFENAMPGGAAHYGRVRTEILGLLTSVGVPTVDVTDDFRREELFADSFHLRASGARRFTGRIAQELTFG